MKEEREENPFSRFPGDVDGARFATFVARNDAKNVYL